MRTQLNTLLEIFCQNSIDSKAIVKNIKDPGENNKGNC